MLLFCGDDTHTDWSIGIEFCTGEPHTKSNSQCINDYYGLLNDCHGLLISWKSSVVAIIRSTPNHKIGVTKVRRRTCGPRFKVQDKSVTFQLYSGHLELETRSHVT